MFCLSEQEKVLVEFLYIISAWRQGEDNSWITCAAKTFPADVI